MCYPVHQVTVARHSVLAGLTELSSTWLKSQSMLGCFQCQHSGLWKAKRLLDKMLVCILLPVLVYLSTLSDASGVNIPSTLRCDMNSLLALGEIVFPYDTYRTAPQWDPGQTGHLSACPSFLRTVLPAKGIHYLPINNCISQVNSWIYHLLCSYLDKSGSIRKNEMYLSWGPHKSMVKITCT